MLRDVREYIDRLQIEGHTIGEDHDDDPVLIDASGRAVDTWRENYPYDERLPREEYEEQKYALQVELLKLQNHQVETRTATSSCSKAGMRRARVARSSGSPST
jgi:polyphosphate kinase 2 (PPK2 family)